ncbi:MAG TPA: hypothetical protein VH683_00735 [Thermoleophilaceae bacterium]|jgi:hypothetical protein
MRPLTARIAARRAPPAACATAVVLLALAGCDSASSDPPPQERPDPLHSYNGRVIRGWLLALERDDFQQAANYFAPGALIDQGQGAHRLTTRELAVNFNSLLPCRADLIRLRGGGHARHVLATFRLRAGPGGDCTGLVRVRYTIVKGKFTEWIQGPDSDSDQPAPSEPA